MASQLYHHQDPLSQDQWSGTSRHPNPLLGPRTPVSRVRLLVHTWFFLILFPAACLLSASAAFAAPATVRATTKTPVTAGGPTDATTGIPSPANSTVPNGILLVGLKNGVPDPLGLFTVTVRDLANNPLANISVEVDFANAPDIDIASSQPYSGLTVRCLQHSVSALTNVSGVASFIIVGSSAGRLDLGGGGALSGGARVRVGGTLIGSPTAATLDYDGANGVGGADVSAWLCDFASGTPYGRGDFDFNGSIGANDLTTLKNAISAGNSAESGSPTCLGGGGQAPAPILVSGGLTLGWSDCRQLGAGGDVLFACNTNVGNVHLIGAVTPPFDLTGVSTIEADIDIYNPSGVLPAWWQFQPGGCRSTTNSLFLTDPSNDVALTCTAPGFETLTLVSSIYPFNGDPNLARIRVTATMDAAGALLTSSDQNPVLDFVLNRTRTTGVPSCAGCSTPVEIALRSMSVYRGDVCSTPASARPADVFFTQTSGLNVAHWQSVTPSFPIHIDATALQNPFFKISVGACFDGSTVQNLSLQVGTYAFIACTEGGQFEFTVGPTGLIQYDSSLEGLVSGAGTTTLTVRDTQISLDARSAPAWTYRADSRACFPNSVVQTERLIPGIHGFSICAGSCIAFADVVLPFRVTGSGLVAYDPVQQGAFTGAGSSTLVVHSWTFPPRGDDEALSVGVFRIVVEPQFWGLMTGYPGYALVNGVHRLVSPMLIDFNTRIGRSSIHADGDAADLAGVPVGSAGTIVSDASFAIVPPGFAGPPGTPEVHTEIRSLNLVTSTPFGNAAVRAGTFAPTRPISPGEIEGSSLTSGLFPAESFFNVFAEVDLPGLGTLYNVAPLMVENSGVDCFPPVVVYQHRHTGPVPVLFKAADTQIPQRWQAGDQLGWLVLAGHGMNWDTVTTRPANGTFGARPLSANSISEFLAIVNAEPEMADTATLVVDVHDVVVSASPSAFTQAAFRDSILNGIDAAAALGKAGNPCAGLFTATRIHQRVDSLAFPPDWVTDQAVRRTLADRILGLSAQLLAQANQSGGCVGTAGTPPGPKPTHLALLGVQPNPSFGRATVRYAVPQRERVNLSVFDLGGRLVRTLVDTEMEPGTYEAVWDGHQDRAGGRVVSSGAYFMRLTAGGRSFTHRLVIIH